MSNFFAAYLAPALLLPILFWPKGPETAPALQAAGLTQIAVPGELASAWKAAPQKIQPVDVRQLTKVVKPAVSFRASDASATREPWVDSNGWRFLRQPDARFLCEAPGKAAALAAAEGYAYGVETVVQTDSTGLKPFAEMVRFLESLPAIGQMPPLYNFEYLDDGSGGAGEFMNLLVRTNLLFKTVKTPAPGGAMTVALGSAQYPISEAGNPKLLAEKVRAHVTDEKRLLRIYGSDVVIGRLIGSGAHARLFLLNYGAERNGVEGVRVRVLGHFGRQHLAEFQAAGTQLLDVKASAGATEFTVPNLPVFAVVDLEH